MEKNVVSLNKLQSTIIDYLLDAYPRGEMYAVGGTVRDLLMGREIKDVDVALRGDPVVVAKACARAIGGSFVWLHERFPTARVIKGDCVFDFTALRGGDIKTDLLSRDFTINALAMPLDNLTRYEINATVDVTLGLDDLKGGVIRMVLRENLVDDPLRLLRAYRFSSQLGFKIEAVTLRTIEELKSLIHRAASERIWSELKAILASDSSTAALESMIHNSLLFELIPELYAAKGVTQNQYHSLDVLQHSMAAYKAAEAVLRSLEDLPYSDGFRQYLSTPSGTKPILKLAILLHDVGKPSTRAVDADGRVTFHRHSAVGADLTRDILLRFKASQREVEHAGRLVFNHMRLNPSISEVMANHFDKKRAMVRLLNKVGADVYAMIIIALADTKAKALPYTDDVMQTARQLLRFYNEEYMPRSQRQRFITGHDLIEGFGLRPSSDFKLILEHVNEMALEGVINSREEALSVVNAYLEHRVTA
ncbi:MAG: CCA tRNA nucleotidyltransferase [Nitrospirae bacterium]|nr:CCA tRNA nucleotidyltransferase [Nitrospirota bacterium]